MDRRAAVRPAAPAHRAQWTGLAVACLAVTTLALGACRRGDPGSGAGQAPAGARAGVSAATSVEAQRLREVTEAYYEQYLRLNPLLATAQGDHRFDAEFGDYVSPTWMAD